MRHDERFKLAPNVLFQPFEDEALLIDLEHETIFSLNRTGRRITTLVQEDRSLSEIIGVLQNEFSSNAWAIESETAQLIEVLVTRELLVKCTDGG